MRGLHLPEPALEDLDAQHRRRGGPQHEAQRGEGDVGARRHAHAAAAEQQLRQEDGERDEAAEEEDRVRELEREVRVRVRAWTSSAGRGREKGGRQTSRPSARHDLEVQDGELGPDGGEDEEVELGGRGREGLGVVPVGDCGG